VCMIYPSLSENTDLLHGLAHDGGKLLSRERFPQEQEAGVQFKLLIDKDLVVAAGEDETHRRLEPANLVVNFLRALLRKDSLEQHQVDSVYIFPEQLYRFLTVFRGQRLVAKTGEEFGHQPADALLVLDYKNSARAFRQHWRELTLLNGLGFAGRDREVDCEFG